MEKAAKNVYQFNKFFFVRLIEQISTTNKHDEVGIWDLDEVYRMSTKHLLTVTCHPVSHLGNINGNR